MYEITTIYEHVTCNRPSTNLHQRLKERVRGGIEEWKKGLPRLVSFVIPSPSCDERRQKAGAIQRAGGGVSRGETGRADWVMWRFRSPVGNGVKRVIG
ncbi:hypothetical protein CEXT_391581 [Caerostris extrusa]|uniref:Uncharacterized protein n=1 Tax=Caerostris extrusa TaxID=172846 RepID=A0AAV4XEP0_CAEEX|nr:hypothetical protein CEXT_391581 [Caerostris extrusa]